jgi:hypothetical protein
MYKNYCPNWQPKSCDGLSYLVSLDDGLPRILNLDAYIRIEVQGLTEQVVQESHVNCDAFN